MQNVTGTSTTTTSHVVALTTAATAGNLIVIVFRVPVLASGLTGAPSGFTQAGTPMERTESTFTMVTYYKVAVGGDNNFTFTTSTSINSRWQVWEFSTTFGWPANPQDKRVSTDPGVGGVTSQTTGTTAATAQAEEIGVAVWATAGAITSPTATNGYSPITSNNVIHTATKVLAATGTQESTMSWTTSRAVVARLVTFAPNTAAPGPLVSSGFFGAT